VNPIQNGSKPEDTVMQEEPVNTESKKDGVDDEKEEQIPPKWSSKNDDSGDVDGNKKEEKGEDE
jgi:hypothetical protein